MTQSPSALPIETSGLSKTYQLGFLMNRRVHALCDLSFKIAPGQIYGLVGPNGAGKSTTLKILMNLVKPSAGRARIFGLSPTQADARRRIGFLPENPAPYEYLTGREFVSLAGRLAGLSGKQLDTRVKQVIGTVEMDGSANLQIRRYSKGMVQRIALAQALVNEPSLLILDEPTSGLDPVGRRQMRDLILQQREKGVTVLFCTHIIPDVEALCDWVAVLVGGRLVREGSVQDLLTTQIPLVEVTIERVTAPTLQTWGISSESTQVLGERLLVRLGDAQAQALIAKTVSSGGKVTKVQPAKYSLEDLFLEALAKAQHGRVGGEIS